MRIYLVGYMGSGKSKTAESLSKILSIPFVDTDKLIEKATGTTISLLFESKGEEAFREIEKQLLRSTSSENDLIVATGGGTPCYFDNMQWMNKNGLTIYLEANAGLLFHRLVLSREGRPLIEKLSDVELMEQITGQLAIRIPYYSKATLKINAANLKVKELALKIKSEIKKIN